MYSACATEKFAAKNAQAFWRPAKTALLRRHFDRLDHDKLTHRTFIQELNPPRNLGEKRVVFSAADIEPRLHASAALPDDDRSARHNLPAKRLEPKPLSI